MDSSSPEQTYMSIDTSIVKNVKKQSVSDMEFNAFDYSRNINLKGISTAGATATKKNC